MGRPTVGVTNLQETKHAGKRTERVSTENLYKLWLQASRTDAPAKVSLQWFSGWYIFDSTRSARGRLWREGYGASILDYLLIGMR